MHRKPPSRKANPIKGRNDWLLAGLLVLLAFAAYLPALNAGFIWDDDDYIIQNQSLRTLEGLRRIWVDPAATPQYYPLTHTTFWLEYQLWGLNPAGFHRTNVFLHALAAILLWRVLAHLKIRGAFLAAAIFALHPVEVESVAWITERKNVLSAVFYFAAALAYVRYTALREAGVADRRRAITYAAALVLFAAALWSKTVACSLPAALLLVAWWRTGRLRRADVLPLLPFFVVGAGLAFMTPWLEKHQVGAEGMEWSLTFIERCLIAGRALWFYAGKLFWPTQLTFMYPRWNVSAEVWWQWIFPIAFVAVVIALWFGRRRIGRGPLVAVLFFAGTLFPALGFFDVYPFRYSFVADHFQHLASVGLIVLAAAGLARFRSRIPAVLVVALLGVLTARQAGIYQDLETLWADTLKKNPECWMAHSNMGSDLAKLGRFDEADEHHQRAARLATNWTTCINLGSSLARRERLDDAIRCYRDAIAFRPGNAEGYNNLGNALLRKGQLDAAAIQYRTALQINPSLPGALNDLGYIHATKEDHARAAEFLTRAVELRPDFALAHFNLARSLQALDRSDEAIREYETALRLEPRNASGYNSLGAVFEKKGEVTRALRCYSQSISLNPKNAEAHFNLGCVMGRIGEKDQAIAHVTEALRLRPGYPQAEEMLSTLKAQTGQ